MNNATERYQLKAEFILGMVHLLEHSSEACVLCKIQASILSSMDDDENSNPSDFLGVVFSDKERSRLIRTALINIFDEQERKKFLGWLIRNQRKLGGENVV